MIAACWQLQRDVQAFMERASIHAKYVVPKPRTFTHFENTKKGAM